MFQVVTTGSGVMSWTDMRAESIPAAFLGTALGIATLDSGGKVPTAQLPASVLGSLKYQGTWNASTNSPALASGVGTTGFYYIVGTAGSTAIDGVSSWKIGDWITFDGTKWDKVDNSVTPLATATPQPLGTAAVGTSGNAAREDHVHQAVPVFGASGGSHASGLVPDPGPTAGTVKNLREDGTWALREYDIGGGCTGKLFSLGRHPSHARRSSLHSAHQSLWVSGQGRRGGHSLRDFQHRKKRHQHRHHGFRGLRDHAHLHAHGHQLRIRRCSHCDRAQQPGRDLV